MKDAIYIDVSVPMAREFIAKAPQEAREAFLKLAGAAYDEITAAAAGPAEPSEHPRWPAGVPSPYGAGWHWKGPGNWHEHDDAEHGHKDGDLPHLHKNFPPETSS